MITSANTRTFTPRKLTDAELRASVGMVTGLGPKMMMISCCSTIETPIADSSGMMRDLPRNGRYAMRSIRKPSTIGTVTAATSASAIAPATFSHGVEASMPIASSEKAATYPPTVNTSPWAKLMNLRTP